jgi:hypothetical protein
MDRRTKRQALLEALMEYKIEKRRLFVNSQVCHLDLHSAVGRRVGRHKS